MFNIFTYNLDLKACTLPEIITLSLSKGYILAIMHYREIHVQSNLS